MLSLGTVRSGSSSMKQLGTFLARALALLLQSSLVPAATQEQTEFFEKKIRPVLVEKCYLCHSGKNATPLGGLRLDTPEGLRKGGDSGPALVPGDPDKSLLIQAISYRSLALKMPPGGKLSDEEIANFETWVRMGAPDPRSTEVSPPAAYEKKEIDFDEGRKFWAFRPLQDPALPVVKQKEWPKTAVDHFVLAKLEAQGLKPAPPADKRTWLRRVTFDLVGLPPTPSEMEAFLRDDATDARVKVVDRLLTSPHYGERWGRHWLDLVRFAETNGHEFDNDKLDAWRYRDYVIRAFNADVPYNQFVKEHIAGDLIPSKRLSPGGAHWESPIGTSFYWFGEVLNSATDSVKSRADEVDNQIDVMGKAFQGLTVACARCHDHKFDPIPTSDYYALAGAMHSTMVSEAVIDSPVRAQQIASVHQKIIDLNGQITESLQAAIQKLAAQLKGHLLVAAARLIKSKGQGEGLVRASQSAHGSLPNAWVELLVFARQRPEQIFYPFVTALDRLCEEASRVADAHPSSSEHRQLSEILAQIRRELDAATTETQRRQNSTSRGDVVYEDFERLDYSGWQVAGQAFGRTPQREIPPNLRLRGFQGQGLASSFGGGSNRLVGSLTSAKFKMPKLFLHVRMAGSREEGAAEKARLRLTLVADGHKSQTLVPDGSGELNWKTVRLTKEIGRLCYFEIVDRSRDGYLVVDEIVLSDSELPPPAAGAPNPHVVRMVARLSQTLSHSPRKKLSALAQVEALATAYQELFIDAFQSEVTGDAALHGLRQALNPTGKLEDVVELLDANESDATGGKPRARKSQDAQAALRQQREQLESTLPESIFAMVGRDENPADVRLHIRGNHKNLGEAVPRRFLQVVAGEDQPPILHGSGRLQLAGWMASEDNPLTARVMVNRVWQHHFGQGLVGSPDNFGKTGDRPTHPELLDFLARQFIARGWSVKSLHRLMLLSSAYAMSSQPSASALKLDPNNQWLQHMPVRRLEAESIRDSILAVAGTLDRQLYGPGVPPHISPYQDGRGKPKSGPLDGGRRRSIYIQVRRNFLTPLFLAFDYPLPISAIGKRSASTVPSQALMLMNNEFVALQAREWARRILAAEASAQERAEQMYLEAFGRPPETWELTEVLDFIQAQEKRYSVSGASQGSGGATVEAWADLAHVLWNSAEFIYVR